MSTPLRFLRPSLTGFITWASLFLGFVAITHAAIDNSVTRRIWKTKFGVTDAQMYSGGSAANGLNTTWMNQDTDGDGVKNGAEVSAGTNPFNRSKSIGVTSVVRNGSAAELHFPTESGKLYRVEATTTLTNANSWALQPQPVPVQIIGDGTTKMLSVPYVQNSFYRIRVDDFDTDGDGVSDWAEMTVTLNPNLAETATGVNDYAYVTEQLALPNVVTIKAAKAFASEDGPEAGWFTVSRTQNLFPITVNYGIGGTALPGIDYASLSGSSSLARGVDSANIFVNPMVQPSVKGGRSVTATLTPPPTTESLFTLGAANSATVIINDSTQPTGTGLLARYYDTSSTNYADAANFGQPGTYVFTRNASPTTTGSIVVNYTSGDFSALQAGHLVKLSFTAGNLNNALYNHLGYPITAVDPANSRFTVSISAAAALPASDATARSCSFSVQSIPHPAMVERVDPVVNFDWIYGTPNDLTVTPNNPVDNYSTVYEAYLHPTTAGNYQFQLDADDRARVLLDTGSGLVQILEHGWDGATTPENIGTFKVSAAIPLVVPASPAARYKIRVEHVETSGDARCRLQWRLGTGTFVNIPSTNVFTHTISIGSYSTTSSVATINTTGAHGLAVNDPVTLNFSTGGLFTPPANFSGNYPVATVVDSDTFTVSIPGAPNTTGTGFLTSATSAASITAGWLNQIYTNTTFTAPAGRVGVDGAGPTNANNGLWGSGAPDPIIGKDTFSARWTGQVQPQFSEEYTFAILADDGVALQINGQPQPLRPVAGVSQSGSTYSFNGTTGDAVITYSGMIAAPNNFVVGETVRIDPTSGNLNHGTATYSYDGATGEAVVTYSGLPGIVPGRFVVGETVQLDPSSGTLSTLGNVSYVITAATPTTFTVNFGTGTFGTGTGNMTISDVRDTVVTAANATSFTVNFGPGKYNTGTGNINVEIVNKSLKDWSAFTSERYVRIPMVGGVRYDIQLDFYEGAGSSRCALSWYSPSQPKQIVPSARLYPSSGTQAPPTVLSPTDLIALVGGAFSYNIAGSNSATVTISGNPAWLTYSNGVLSGTPPPGAGGDYQVTINLTNAAGTATSVLNLHVEETGGNVVRESWNGIAGTNLGSIPVNSPPTGTANLSSLEAPVNFGDDYGARMRGYITAPATGNYYFWLAGSNAAELWISNDHEPVNAVKRAWIINGTASQSWSGNAGEPNQKSPWLALEAGQKYYFEVLHKAGAGSGDNVAVGWLKPGQSGNVPSEIVPGYALSPWAELVALDPGSTVYSAILRPQGAIITNASGSSFLRVNSAETEATLTVKYNDLSSEYFGMHVHNDMIPGGGLSNIICDLDEPGDVLRLPDGSFHWVIRETAGRSVAQLIADLKAGKLYFNVHSTNNPGGEIKGYYSKVDGSQTFTPPPPPPAWADDHTTDAGAVRFLTQATFGANITDITALKGMASYEAWIDDQFTKPASQQLPEVLYRQLADRNAPFEEQLTYNAWWRNSITGPDQLRQRIAFALSEIHVVSAAGPLDNNARGLSYFYDMLAANAFGNFRDILTTTTLTPAMGRYLDMLRNDKPDLTIGRIPNENYAREIKQLFSIGLFRMWPDGTLVLNSKYEPIETYTQREIVGYSHVFTGWDYGYNGGFFTGFSAAADWTRPMREVPARHFTGPKRILDNEVLPGLPTLGGQPLDPYATHNSTHLNNPAYQALPGQEFVASHDQLFNHPNTGPFICRQLIQRLVTSHPSNAYLYRVVQKFNDNGAGVRGDMKAVIKAILLDYEARHPSLVNAATFGKQREPVMRVAAAARALRRDGFSGTYTQAGGRTITIDTATPHKLASGNNVYLDFSTGTPAPTSGVYGLASVATATRFTVNAMGWANATYNQPAGSSVLTVTLSNHWLAANHKVFLDFTSGTANGLAGLDNLAHVVQTSSGETGTNATFTITAPDTTARSGNVMMVRFTGSFFISNSGLAAPQNQRILLHTSNGDHHLNVNDPVFLNFSAGNPRPVDAEFVVESIVDRNSFTVLTTGQTNQSENGMFIFPLVAQPLTRSGNVAAQESTFILNSTNADFSQSPLNSPTVFNFFLPDYKFPGVLAAQGLTTPEFQETSDTNVVRQANFLFNGVFNPGNTNGISSFKSGGNSLVMDFSPWMGTTGSNTAADLGLGAPATTTQAWTGNENLATLINHFNNLLLAGQLAPEARTLIQNFLTYERTITALATGNPCTVTTSTAHGLATGDGVTISGVSGGTFSSTINTTHTVTVVNATTFRVNINYSSSSGINLTNARASYVPYVNTAPTDTNKRDRLRAILHFILTSPDYTIQR